MGSGAGEQIEFSPAPVADAGANVLAVTGGALHTCAISADHNRCSGRNTFGQLGDGTTVDSPDACHREEARRNDRFGEDEAQVAVASLPFQRAWEQLAPAEQQRIVRLLLARVVVSVDALEMHLRPLDVPDLARELALIPQEVACA